MHTNVQSTIFKKIIIHSVFQSTRNIRAFSGIDNTLVYKTSLRKFKRIEITSSICSNNNSMKQEINHKKRNKENNYMEIKQHANKYPVGHDDIKKDIKRQMTMKTQSHKIFGMQLKQS